MKKTIALISALFLCFLLSFNTLALDTDFSIKVPKNFVAADEESNLIELSKIFSVSDDSLEEYFDENDIIFMAADKENTCQVVLSKTNNEFSEGTISFTLLSNDELESLSQKIAGESFSELGIVNGKDDNKYIKLQKHGNDSGGQFDITEYITVCNGDLYTLSVYVGENSEYKDLLDTAFKSLKIDNSLLTNSSSNLIYTILAIAGISFLVALIVYLLYTVIKDCKKTNN